MKLTVSNINEALSGRCKDSRKLANNTYLVRRDSEPGKLAAVRLHNTDIITISPRGVLTVDVGPWQTYVTKERLNRYLPRGIHQEKGIWYWCPEGCNWDEWKANRIPFTNGDRFNAKGKLIAQATGDTVKAQRKLRSKINKYAAACQAAIPLPAPGPGNCWLCHMEGQTGELTPEHIRSHMDEGYLVPRLVYNALKDAGNSDLVISGAFVGAHDWASKIAKDRVKRHVARYLRKALGLPV